MRCTHNLRLGRELAGRLAGGAQKVADTLEQLAAFHERLAAVTTHPLSGEATERAASERRMAARERAASAWFSSIADGTYRPATPAGG